ncbi:MAG: hypothetical protein M3R17_04150 [Bacteroidota bacterium]|nr:hypothetical protein [Bacteroidota bacterium]
MKKSILLALFTSMLSLYGYSESVKSIPTWYVGESKKDFSLSKNEAVFELHFSKQDGGNEIAPGDTGSPAKDVIFSYNSKMDTIEFNAKTGKNIKIMPGKYIFQFYYGSFYYEIKTDSIAISGGYRTPLYVNFRSSSSMIICDKPVIYVYPQDTQQVSIRLDLKGEIGFTYPYYDIGWNFTADPDGTIHMNDKKYHYLFWDGTTAIDNNSIDWNEGFIVERDSLVPFFEEKLKLMGLNSKEIEDYITYWCPRMVANEKNYIHFMFNETYNEYAGLEVTPAPDQMFRVFMLWTKAEENKNTQVIPQEIESFERSGFTIVEWGGAEMQNIPVIFDAQASN